MEGKGDSGGGGEGGSSRGAVSGATSGTAPNSLIRPTIDAEIPPSSHSVPPASSPDPVPVETSEVHRESKLAGRAEAHRRLASAPEPDPEPEITKSSVPMSQRDRGVKPLLSRKYGKRFCKKCKATFEGEFCPEKHASFMYQDI